MRTVVVGLGIQGRKRMVIAARDVVATVDSYLSEASYKSVDEVPLDSYDAVVLCTPDLPKTDILSYLLLHGKQVLVEKPLVAPDSETLSRLAEIARSNGSTCYTAYNHRFEPHIARLKKLLDLRILGAIYLAKFFYGNGTALDVRRSPWRDQGLGVVSDLGSHLLDLILFLFGKTEARFRPWCINRFENRAPDYFLCVANGKPVLELEGSLVCWRNTFTADVFGELGSAHIRGLCKWGPSTLTVRKRVFPSGRPVEEEETIESPDPTWKMEYEHFRKLCEDGSVATAENFEKDIWINNILNDAALAVERGQTW